MCSICGECLLCCTIAFLSPYRIFCFIFQISDVMYYLENRAYVFRSYEVICDAAFELIHSSKHGDKVKSETANAIGRVGFVLATYNDGDFDIYWKYYKKLWDKFREVGTRKEKDLVYYIKGL